MRKKRSAYEVTRRFLARTPPDAACERLVIALWWPWIEEIALRAEAKEIFKNIVKGAR